MLWYTAPFVKTNLHEGQLPKLVLDEVKLQSKDEAVTQLPGDCGMVLGFLLLAWFLVGEVRHTALHLKTVGAECVA